MVEMSKKWFCVPKGLAGEAYARNACFLIS